MFAAVYIQKQREIKKKKKGIKYDKDIGSDLLHSRISGATSQLLETWVQGQIVLNEATSISLLGKQAAKKEEKLKYCLFWWYYILNSPREGCQEKNCILIAIDSTSTPYRWADSAHIIYVRQTLFCCSYCPSLKLLLWKQIWHNEKLLKDSPSYGMSFLLTLAHFSLRNVKGMSRISKLCLGAKPQVSWAKTLKLFTVPIKSYVTCIRAQAQMFLNTDSIHHTKEEH